MKMLSVVGMRDGTRKEIWTDEKQPPAPGDGKMLEEIPVKIVSVITTPISAEVTGHDLVVLAEEQDH